MSDTVSFAEFDGQHVQLLPARTVLSMFSTVGEGGGIPDGGGLVETVMMLTGTASSTQGPDGSGGSGDNSR